MKGVPQEAVSTPAPSTTPVTFSRTRVSHAYDAAVYVLSRARIPGGVLFIVHRNIAASFLRNSAISFVVRLTQSK